MTDNGEMTALPDIDARAEAVIRSMPGLFGNCSLYAYVQGENCCSYVIRITRYDEMQKLVNVIKRQFQLVLLYHHSPSADTDFGEECSAFCRPGLGSCYRIDARSNGRGDVDELKVTIFETMENLGGALVRDLKKRFTYGKLWEGLSLDQLLLLFC